jgi:hypothetical protein
MRGREYAVRIAITYAGGALPGDIPGVLTSALVTALRDEAPDLSVTSSTEGYSVVTVAATLRGTTPLGPLTRLDTVLDDVLLRTGLFERFDVGGKVLRAEPVTPAWK